VSGRRIALAMMLLALATPASAAMSVSVFLAKAEALKSKGPLALFSSDLKLLEKQIKSDAAELRAERMAAQAAGKPAAFCPPQGGVKLNDRDVLAAMEAVPAAQRPATTTKQVMRSLMAKRFPCRG
jgi:hypothetical protein